MSACTNSHQQHLIVSQTPQVHLRVIIMQRSLTDNSSGRWPSRRFSTSFCSKKTNVPSIDIGAVTMLTLSDNGNSSFDPFRISTQVNQTCMANSIKLRNSNIWMSSTRAVCPWILIQQAHAMVYKAVRCRRFWTFPNFSCSLLFCIFTALRGMQVWSSDENSVCPSVRLSVRLSHAWIVTKR